jgi:hypothetical protein
MGGTQTNSIVPVAGPAIAGRAVNKVPTQTNTDEKEQPKMVLLTHPPKNRIRSCTAITSNLGLISSVLTQIFVDANSGIELSSCHSCGRPRIKSPQSNSTVAAGKRALFAKKAHRFSPISSPILANL